LSDLKELNQTPPPFMTQDLDQNQCIPWTSAEIFPGWGDVQISLILYRLLTMPCKWKFTKRFTLSTTLVCAGLTSLLNRLSAMFSTLRLSEMLLFS